MGSYLWELSIWMLLIMAGATCTVASQAHGTETNHHYLPKERYNDTFLEIKKDFSDLKDFYAAARDGNIGYIITQLEEDNSSSSSSNSNSSSSSYSSSGNSSSSNSISSGSRFKRSISSSSSVISSIKSIISSTISNLFTWLNEDRDNRTALYVAVEEGHDHVVLALLDAGANPDVEDEWGWTPVHIAARRGRIAALRALLEAGASPNVVDVRGKTPVHLAAMRGHTGAVGSHSDAIEVLVAHGAKVNTVDNGGRSPLIEASFYGRVATVQALINAGATLGDADHERGRTALHWAAVFNQPDVVRVLLENGADKELQEIHGRTPAVMARELGSVERGLTEIADLIDNWQ